MATLVIFGVLVYSGLLKLQEPTTTAGFLERLVGISWRWTPGAIAVLEIVVALWLVSGWAPGLAGLSAAGLFIAFAVMHAMAWSLGIDGACGCLGQSDLLERLPHSVWIALTVTLAAISPWTVRSVPLRSGRAISMEAPS
ncbi:MAG: hypothetical protein IBJ10_06690 [Phycisphaerales bacterium]|nr:hypothetical protein [Phycisphaerales bacterium]